MALVTVRRDSLSGSSQLSSEEDDDFVNPEEVRSSHDHSSSKSSKRRHGSITHQPSHFLHQQLPTRRYRTGSDVQTSSRDNHARPSFISSVVSAPPYLGVPASAPSCSSSWSMKARRPHYDVALRVMLKKHECQFKLSQGELQTHLHAIFHHLRAQDNIKLAVRLESWNEEHRRYLVIISTTGRQDTEESIIVGCDFETKKSTTCTIGLVLPLWCDTSIRLDGDGGFRVEIRDRIHTFKPVSVQAMWSALQSLHRCVEISRRNNYYDGSLYLTWTGFYTNKISSERLHINEWNYTEEIFKSKEFYEKPDPKRIPVENLIRSKLKKVMMEMDLDNCTCKQIRMALEGEIDMDLREYKEYIDTEMLAVLGRMDCASKILDYLYLGSEWNASNIEELEDLGITHILNVTKEIDNLYPDNFRYKTIRLYDCEESDLLPHWNHTWKFIAEARKYGGKCLVHCKMGISRSAATVCAYLMKEKLWTKDAALEYVKSRRSIISPNPAFRKQLEEYEGIIFASAQRHNKLFRSRSESSLSEPSVNEDATSLVSRLPQIQPDETGYGVTMHEFDLNRRLLDLTSAGVHKISRPKSWSPDESRHLFYSNSVYTDPVYHRYFNANEVANHNFRLQNFSEPVHLMSPSSVDLERRKICKELRREYVRRRAHLRRHTTTTAPRGGELQDLAQSEDSVFVHDGAAFVRLRRSRKKRETKAKKTSVLASSPAAPQGASLSDRPQSLPVQSTPIPPGASALKSPSYINAKNVDIDRLKSRFSADMSSVVDDVISDVAHGASPTVATSVPVREIVAVIESPQEDNSKLKKLASGGNLKSTGMSPSHFVRGHHKTASLPPRSTVQSADCPLKTPANNPASHGVAQPHSRNRSLSETQANSFSVKKIVTAIESGGNLTGDDSETLNADEIYQSKPGGIGAKKMVTSSSFVTEFAPLGESAMENEEDDSKSNRPSTFYIGDSERPPPSKIMTWCGTANLNNNNSQPIGRSPNEPPESLSPIRETPRSKHPPPYPADFLKVIEKVGLQLLCSVEGSIKSSKSSEDGAHPGDGGSGKKRGVRQMVREIEKSVRRLRGKAPKSSLKSRKAIASKSMQPVASPNQNFSKYVALSPTASPELNQISPAGGETRTDVHVRELVNRFDTPLSPSPSAMVKTPFEPSSPTIFSTPRIPPKQLTDLVTPLPYRSPEKHKPGARLKLSSKTSVRRSQSERVGTRSSTSKRPGNFRSFRMTHSNFTPVTRTHRSHPELNKTPYKSLRIVENDSQSLPNHNVEQCSTPPVQEIITNIEKKCVKRSLSSTSVQRSSSMPLSAKSTSRSTSGMRRSLRKTKSTPYLDCSIPSRNHNTSS